MLEQLFAIGGDIAFLRIGVLVFAFTLVYALALRSEVFGDRKLALFVALVVSFIAVLGFSDRAVVAIIAGYSGLGTALLFLLPVIALVALLFWRSESLSVSLLKLVAAILVLAFIELTSSALLPLGASYGLDLDSVVGLIAFVLYIVIFFFAIDVIGKLFFRSE